MRDLGQLHPRPAALAGLAVPRLPRRAASEPRLKAGGPHHAQQVAARWQALPRLRGHDAWQLGDVKDFQPLSVRVATLR